ncbi:MAG: ABC transporter substrate-binding protein [Paracoccaceae bacterium]
MTRIDRRALFASGAAAALLTATGVSAAPKRGGQLRAALSGSKRDDIWLAAGSGLMMQAATSAVHEGLTEIAADGTLRGRIAKTWVGQDAGRIWTFDLEENVVFHDGSTLSAQDVAYSLKDLGRIESRGLQITLTLETPDLSLPYKLAGPDYLIRAEGRPGVGTGFYRLHKFDAGRHFIGDRVDTHWRADAAGWFDRIEFVHFADDAVRAQALAEGLVDVADGVKMTDVPNMHRLPDDSDVMQIARYSVGLPAQVGRIWPLDNLRMAERWWRA